MMLALWLACTGQKCEDDTGGCGASGESAADTADESGGETQESGGETGEPASYNGTEPITAIPAPTFEATNRDETVRTRDDLLGHPTVVWFYPAANTGG
jgi:hypothetical protein